jgi:hypothetical protein
MKDFGRLTINVRLNNLHAFGLGFDFYPIVEMIDGTNDALVLARALHLDFLFFFIQITVYPKVRWYE